MSDIFSTRERIFESIFTHELEVEYRTRARADLYFGLWAAQQLKMDDQEKIKQYALKLMESEAINIRRHIDIVLADFATANIKLDRQDLLHQYTKFYQQARAELMGK